MSWARDEVDLAQAQRLRFRVFAVELGASLDDAEDAPEQDIDSFDAHCLHLLIRASTGCAADGGDVIATCRLLTPAGAADAGGRYTDGEFDLEPLRALLPHAVEMGRVCIDPAWRNGLLVMAMWKTVGDKMARLQLDTLIGCASVSLADGGALASQLWGQLRLTHLVPAALQVVPRQPLDVAGLAGGGDARVPRLMKAYMRCGGRLLGPPSIDRNFNTADFPMMMNLGDLPPRYTRRVLARPA